MDFVHGMWIYIIVAISLCLTSYITIFRHAVEYSEEILDEISEYKGVFGFTLWVALATLFAPATLVLLVANDNKKVIEDIAVQLAEKQLEDDE